MNNRFLFAVLVSLFMGQTMTAQSVFSPNVNSLRSSYQMRRAASADAVRDRIAIVVTCSEDASPATIANQMKGQGAVIRALMGNQIVADLPMSQLEAVGAIEGVLLIDQPSAGSRRTDTARKASHVDEAHAGQMAGMQSLPQAYTGKGVIIGLIDGGFDYTHPMFKDKDGNLRIKGVYQPQAVDAAHTSKSESLADIPVTDEKGVTTSISLTGSFYTDPEVILDTTIVKDVDGMHGTHCASIAAGSYVDYTGTFVPKYESSGRLGGMAPEADIFMAEEGVSEELKATNPAIEDWGSYNALQALSAMKHFADKQGKPLVVSWSVNGHDGFHDGTSTMARYVGNYCKAGNVLALCASNEGDLKNYLTRELKKDKPISIMCLFNRTNNMTFLMYPSDKNIQVDLALLTTECEVKYRCNLGMTTDPTAAESKRKFSVEIAKGVAVADYPEHQSVADGLAQYIEEGTFAIETKRGTGLDKNDKPFTYTILGLSNSPHTNKSTITESLVPTLVVTSLDEDIDIQVWADGNSLCADYSDDVEFDYGSSIYSVGDWNTSGQAVTIGAYTTDINEIAFDPTTHKTQLTASTSEELGRYASFSSYGYDFSAEPRSYPDVSAPGVNIYAAANSFNAKSAGNEITTTYLGQYKNQGDMPDLYGYICSSGTSMATPAAAGIIALWVQAAKDKGKTLTNADIKDIIKHTSDTDEFTEDNSVRYGAGKINAYKGLLYVLGLDTAIPELSAQHISVRLEGRTLYIAGNSDIQVTLYNISGQKVLDTRAVQGTVQLPELPTGVYAVKIGNQGSTLIRL